MSIQDLGSLGELIAAIATVATIAYLAVQVRQNTRALRSSTFQGISEQMAQNVAPIVMHPDVAALMIKGIGGLGSLTPEERVRFQSMLVATFRRMESVHVQAQLGSIDPELARGFERSMLSILHSPGGAEWWATAKLTFHDSFVAHVGVWLDQHPSDGVHPSMGISL